MPRPATVTPDNVVKAIRESSTPFCTTGDLAEHLDVTRQAIRDQRALLNVDERIAEGAAGNSTVYYLSNSTFTGGSGDARKPLREEMSTNCLRPGCEGDAFREYQDANGNALTLCLECYVSAVLGPDRVSSVVREEEAEKTHNWFHEMFP